MISSVAQFITVAWLDSSLNLPPPSTTAVLRSYGRKSARRPSKRSILKAEAFEKASELQPEPLTAGAPQQPSTPQLPSTSRFKRFEYTAWRSTSSSLTLQISDTFLAAESFTVPIVEIASAQAEENSESSRRDPDSPTARDSLSILVSEHAGAGSYFDRLAGAHRDGIG